MTETVCLNPTELQLERLVKGEAFDSLDTSFGRQMGLTRLGISITETPPGKASVPFHNHHGEDEIFIILSGSGIYRFGERRIPFKAGDVLAAPAGGAETAHQILNTGSEPVRYFSISNQATIDVIEYPDSGKMLSRVRDKDGKTALRHMTRPEGSLDYWDGEPGA